MKNLIGTFCLLILLLSSCSKKKELVEEISKQEILDQKIKDIIPQKYLDSLKKLGLTIHTGFNPPNIEGTYIASPLILKATSVPNEWMTIGGAFVDGKFKFLDQTKDFDIKMLGQHLLRERDTSIVTAVAGSGNDFTVYGKVRSYAGTRSAIFALIISGTKEGIAIRNFKIGIINIDDSKGGEGAFIPEGSGRIAEDKNGISESIDPSTFSFFPQEFETRTTIGKFQ